MMLNDADVVLLVQALLDHCDELRTIICDLRTELGYEDICSDITLDIRDYPAFIVYSKYLQLHYDK